MAKKNTIVVANPWEALRRFTPARIALGRSGTSLPTRPHLDFQLAHARARKAVHHEMDFGKIAETVARLGLTPLHVHSAAVNRAEYLQRPDKGRRLDEPSRETIAAEGKKARGFDVGFVVGDGLSALAIEENAASFLSMMLPQLEAQGWRVAPPVLVKQARVAVADEIGALLRVEIAVILIGERPGLSSPDSMGIYMTYGPRPGLTDEARNCISNVRKAGLSAEGAAFKLTYLLNEARRRKLSGVELKDQSDALAVPVEGTQQLEK